MKSLYLMFILLLLETVDARIVRKAPAFATPRYSDSHVPAAMQVIFHGVEQYKNKQEDGEQAATSTTVPTTIPHSPGQHQPTGMPTDEIMSTEKPTLTQEASESETETEKPSDNIQLTPSNTDENPEISAETPEAIHGTPETNHESPEEIHEVREINQEMPQIIVNNQEITDENSNDKFETTTISLNSKPQENNQSNSSSEDSSSSSSSSEEEKNDDDKKNKEPSIDSVVKEIYEIMKPQNKSKNSSEDSSDSSESDESIADDSDEDENDENRFTMLGEKVSQVPRPSLITYLKRSKIPSNCTTIQQLALLYDALSKDTRKQGLAQYHGYSNSTAETLMTSAEGGMGPQLKILLGKIIDNNEVVRSDTRAKVLETLELLNDPGSQFNRDLSTLHPLRFVF